MWLITTFGFFSVVQKPGQRAAGLLTVRGRVRADLEALRARYLPTLGPITAGQGTDYKYRAVAPDADVGTAFGRAVADIDYSNFKNAVAAAQGSKREGVYHGLWNTLRQLADEDVADRRPAATAFGGVVFDGAGRVLLRKPAGEFDGYVWTFPKGRPAAGEAAERTALREVREEAGVAAVILGEVPGVFRGGTSDTAYYLMRPVRDTGDFDPAETERVTWADPDEAGRLIGQTRNAVGRRRDLDVLAAAVASHGRLGRGDRN